MVPIKLTHLRIPVTITIYCICYCHYYFKTLIEMVNEIKQQILVTALDWVPVPASKRDHKGQKK
jgi:hypothetical protein